MKASILDLRRRMKDVLSSLNRNEAVTIFYRGKKKGILYPVKNARHNGSVMKHPAFGMWKDRKDMQDVDKLMQKLRSGRTHAV